MSPQPAISRTPSAESTSPCFPTFVGPPKIFPTVWSFFLGFEAHVPGSAWPTTRLPPFRILDGTYITRADFPHTTWVLCSLFAFGGNFYARAFPIVAFFSFPPCPKTVTRLRPPPFSLWAICLPPFSTIHSVSFPFPEKLASFAPPPPPPSFFSPIKFFRLFIRLLTQLPAERRTPPPTFPFVYLTLWDVASPDVPPPTPPQLTVLIRLFPNEHRSAPGSPPHTPPFRPSLTFLRFFQDASFFCIFPADSLTIFSLLLPPPLRLKSSPPPWHLFLNFSAFAQCLESFVTFVPSPSTTPFTCSHPPCGS